LTSTNTNTPAAEVRAAANLLRAHAERATPRPWTASPVWSANSPSTSAVYSLALPPGSEVIGSTRSVVVGPTQKYGGCWRPQDAEYIALMHPLAARVLAELLDRIGEDMAAQDAVDQIPSGAGVVDEDGMTRADWTSALELVRAIAGHPLLHESVIAE
jgi:hypothetical protein